MVYVVAGSAGAAGEVYPGWGMGGWAREGYTGTPPDPSQGPNISIFLRYEPTHGQMKAILEVS